jgi:hypothetical protein
MNPATMQQDSSIIRPIIFTLIVHGTILYTIHYIFYTCTELYSGKHIEKSVIQ